MGKRRKRYLGTDWIHPKCCFTSCFHSHLGTLILGWKGPAPLGQSRKHSCHTSRHGGSEGYRQGGQALPWEVTARCSVERLAGPLRWPVSRFMGWSPVSAALLTAWDVRAGREDGEGRPIPGRRSISRLQWGQPADRMGDAVPLVWWSKTPRELA